MGVYHSSTVLIEATCNQVNHLGGYTGMLPATLPRSCAASPMKRDARQTSSCLAVTISDRFWRDRAAEEAMAEAERMVAAYVDAGFRKIHLDASMGCLGEPAASTMRRRPTAPRGWPLSQRLRQGRQGLMPVYVIGTEVPPPGGADHALTTIEPTAASAARQTIEVHRRVFAEAGLAGAFERAIGLVVQPGVEFGNHNVIRYDRSKIDALTRCSRTSRNSCSKRIPPTIRAPVPDGPGRRRVSHSARWGRS